MYFQILLGYLLGYVTIEIEGYFIERFMNLCNNQKIFLCNLQRTHSTTVKVNMNIRDFKKIKQIGKKTFIFCGRDKQYPSSQVQFCRWR